MDLEVALDFRDQLRAARAVALKDTESFEAVVFVIERIGVYLPGRIDGLGKYLESIAEEARRSPLAETIPIQTRDWHTNFANLYRFVQHARNDALHEGAFARHLTSHAVELALILEDALMADAVSAHHFMVKEPVCARWWQPISSVRRSMLENSFSFLPVRSEVAGDSGWKLVSDFSLARYLRDSKFNAQRNERLAKQLGKAVESGDIELVPVSTCNPEEPISRVLEVSGGQPVLVVDSKDELRGIITPFDIL